MEALEEANGKKEGHPFPEALVNGKEDVEIESFLRDLSAISNLYLYVLVCVYVGEE